MHSKTPGCSAHTQAGFGFGQYTCSRNGKVERDGKWYCKQHDPVGIKERGDRNYAKWNANNKRESDERKAKAASEAHRDKCEAALAGLNPEALAGLIAAVEHFLDMNEMCDAGWQELFDAREALEATSE